MSHISGASEDCVPYIGRFRRLCPIYRALQKTVSQPVTQPQLLLIPFSSGRMCGEWAGGGDGGGGGGGGKGNCGILHLEFFTKMCRGVLNVTERG